MFKKLLLICAISTLVFGSQKVFDLNLNSDDLEVRFQNPIYINANQYASDSSYIAEAGFISSDSNSLFSLGFFLKSHVQSVPNLKAQMGIKAVYANSYASDIFVSFPLGIALSYDLLTNAGEFFFNSSLYYAPSPLSFKDADSYLEFRAEAGLEIIKNGDLYIGYRTIDTDYDTADVSFNQSGYLGFRISI